MEKMIFESEDAVRKELNCGNKEKELSTANAILAGAIEIKQTEAPSAIVEQPVNQELTGNQPAEPKLDILEPVVVDEPIINEVERQQRYNEFIEKKAQEEREKYLIDLKVKEDQLKQEKAEREELEKKLQQLSQLKQEQLSTSTGTQEDEDELATEYSRRTRQMVEELKSQVGDSPVVKELVEKIRSIESEYQSQKQDALKIQQEKVRKDQEEKIFDSIRQFQLKNSELQTKKDIKEMDQEYLTFRKNIAYITKAKSSKEVDDAIKDYRKNGEIKKLADKHGIKPMEDYDKYIAIADLIDVKTGVQRDPMTGEEKPILDENGNQVRYRSLDEVYKLSRYYDDLTNVRQKTLKEVSKKLETINNAPPTIPNEASGEFVTGFSLEQEKEILSWEPKEWVNNPAKKKMVENVYLKRGLDIPRYRGRK